MKLIKLKYGYKSLFLLLSILKWPKIWCHLKGRIRFPHQLWCPRWTAEGRWPPNSRYPNAFVKMLCTGNFAMAFERTKVELHNTDERMLSVDNTYKQNLTVCSRAVVIGSKFVKHTWWYKSTRMSIRQRKINCCACKLHLFIHVWKEIGPVQSKPWLSGENLFCLVH